MFKSLINRALKAAHLSYHTSTERNSFRIWLNIDGPGERYDSVGRLEFATGGFHLGSSVRLDDDCEGGVSLHVGFGPAHVYLATDHRDVQAFVKQIAEYLPKDFYGQHNGKYGAELYTIDGDLIVRVYLGETRDGYQFGADPAKRRRRGVYINVKDLLLGSTDYHPARGEPEMRTLYLAEGSYKIKLERNESTWTRPRWPFPHRSTSYHWEVTSGPHGDSTPERQVGLPVPGKGENSYDCEDDAVFGGGIQGRNADEALGNILAMVQHDRSRRSHPGWTPEPASNPEPEPVEPSEAMAAS